MDRFIEEASGRGLPMRHRLDAQSLLWAIQSEPPPDVKGTTPGKLLDEENPPQAASLNGWESIPLSYSVSDIMADGCFLESARLEEILEHLSLKKNLILQGPPGTGKTWLARKLAFALIGYKDEGKVQAVQFHPNLSYEDFVRGWRPSGDGRLDLVDGPFLEMIEAARSDLVLSQLGGLVQTVGQLTVRKCRWWRSVMVRDKSTPEQREELRRLIRVGKSSARVNSAQERRRLAGGPGGGRWLALSTVYRIKQRFSEDAGVLNRPRKLDKAHLIALACSPAPEGQPLDPASAGWEGGGVGFSLLHVPRGGAKAAQKNALKPWQKQEWCIPQVSAEFVAHMEDVLDLYAELTPSDRWSADVHPVAGRQGRLPAQREDYDTGKGTLSQSVACEPLAGWRHSDPAAHHADFAADALAGG